MKKNLTARVVRGIRKMIQYVNEHPAEYNQEKFPSICGSPFCSAGHIIMALDKKKFNALMLNGDLYGSVNWEREAMDTLGLSQVFFSPRRIFYSGYEWPNKFAKMYEKARYLKTEKGRKRAILRVFTARWEALIESDANDLRYKAYNA